MFILFAFVYMRYLKKAVNRMCCSAFRTNEAETAEGVYRHNNTHTSLLIYCNHSIRVSINKYADSSKWSIVFKQTLIHSAVSNVEL